jgi:hypothetical protein
LRDNDGKTSNTMHFLMNRLVGFGTRVVGKRAVAAVIAVVATAASVMAYQACKRRTAHQARVKQLKQAQESAFENRYFKEYDELADDPDAPVPPRNSHVRETTPQGDVIMTYDADRSLFCYYCDKRSVQFKYLESVARKYVVEHGCKRLYIDFREELTKAKTNADPTIQPAKAAVTATSVFAQLKKYSTSKPIAPFNKAATSRAATSRAATSTSTSNPDRAHVLKEHVTRYLHCGRLDDFIAVADAPTEEHDFNVIKPVDYASYKKLHAS